MAGALETAHRLGILHRDVKPANILLTDYGEPALTDFGIAHIAGGFETATGAVTGSPAFTAPEVLAGEPPSPAADVYGLGATLFAALTGHAAFERRSGEQVVAQFLRITTQPVPDLREHGIPDDVARSSHGRCPPSPAASAPPPRNWVEELRESQLHHGFPVDEMALRAEPGAAHEQGPSDPTHPRRGTMRQPVRRFGRDGKSPPGADQFRRPPHELTEAKNLLAASRLVTLTGIGGVGKTRLAMRVAAKAAARVRRRCAAGRAG